MKTFKEWLSKKIDEMGGAMAGTGPYIDTGKKPKGFNIWGAPGAGHTSSVEKGPIIKSSKKTT